MSIKPLQVTKFVFSSVKAIGALTVTAVAGGIAYSIFGIDHERPISPAIDAEKRAFSSARAGRLNYYVDKTHSGRPLLLVHSINAAPSAHEMRPLFTHYRQQRPVFALDLPGFGFSDRSQRRYSPQLFTEAIVDFMEQEIGEAADVVALSLGSEFVAHAALAAPHLFHSLALISPSGLGAEMPDVPEERLYSVFSFPLWSQPFYDLLSSRASIKLFLGRNFVGDPPQAFLDYAYDTSHQPGAKNAPLYFLSGQLFTKDVRTAVYEKLNRPALIIYDRDPNVSFAKLPQLLAANKKWQAKRVGPSLGLPHWEQPAETTAVLDAFWAEQSKQEQAESNGSVIHGKKL